MARFGTSSGHSFQTQMPADAEFTFTQVRQAHGTLWYQ